MRWNYVAHADSLVGGVAIVIMSMIIMIIMLWMDLDILGSAAPLFSFGGLFTRLHVRAKHPKTQSPTFSYLQWVSSAAAALSLMTAI